MLEALREFGGWRLVVTGSREVRQTAMLTVPFKLALAILPYRKPRPPQLHHDPGDDLAVP